jgi:hypothetical protein
VVFGQELDARLHDVGWRQERITLAILTFLGGTATL